MGSHVQDIYDAYHLEVVAFLLRAFASCLAICMVITDAHLASVNHIRYFVATQEGMVTPFQPHRADLGAAKATHDRSRSRIPACIPTN